MAIKILVTCYNASRYIKRSILSLKGQTVLSWHCYIMDDLSTDGSPKFIAELINGDPRFTLIVNQKKRYQAGNYWQVLQREEIDDEDICINLDGDDWLSGPEVFSNVLRYYQDPNIWITCGKYVSWQGEGTSAACFPAGGTQPRPFGELRRLPFESSSLRTYKVWLFRTISKQDLLGPDGSFYAVAGDLAFMFPMLEMAGEKHSFYTDEINYIYNQENALNDHKINCQLQLDYDRLIRLKKPYARLHKKPKVRHKKITPEGSLGVPGSNLLKIQITDFWAPSSQIIQTSFFTLLAEHYTLQLSDEPDVLFFSVFGDDHQRFSCLKVFYSGENIKPNPLQCDFSFSFEPTSKTNFQMPVFAFIEHDFFSLCDQNYSTSIRKQRASNKSKFCNFLYSKQGTKERIEFCKNLAHYQPIDCPGKVLNNMPKIDTQKKFWWSKTKLDFLQHYKFTICFENERAPHYVTEKIFHALLVNTIPIYWGACEVVDYFNPESFINCADYTSLDQVIERVIEIDNDAALYNRYQTAPAVISDSRLHGISKRRILERVAKIVQSGTVG